MITSKTVDIFSPLEIFLNPTLTLIMIEVIYTLLKNEIISTNPNSYKQFFGKWLSTENCNNPHETDWQGEV